MKKTILTILIIASMAITGLFAANYTEGSNAIPGQNAIIEATMTTTPYTFRTQYGEGTLGTSATATENISLDSDASGAYSVKTTASPFSIATIAKGNETSAITVTAIIETGAFIRNSDSQVSTSFPYIANTSAGSTITKLLATESYSYLGTELTTTKYIASSTGTYTRTLRAGAHLAGTLIGQFKLEVKGNDTVAAGNYTSTSIITISADQA
jgi:hypothetical protein